MLAPNIGHNNPPGPIDTAAEAIGQLGVFLQDTPVIEDFAQCKAGDAWIERTRIALQSMEDERAPRVAPLNAELEAINKPYRLVRQPLEKLFAELRRRVSVFKNKVEADRIAEATRLRLEAETKERAAREAEADEAAAMAGADVGECTDVGGAITQADSAFRDFQVADRTAARAERSVPVRVASIVGGKTLSMRTKRVIVIDGACKAIKAMGLTEKIAIAIKQSAMAFEEVHGELPAGTSETFERSM